MKYMLLVHHDEEAFVKLSENKQQQMLEESVDLTHQLHAKRQYIKASPLQPAATRSALLLGFQGHASEPSKSGP